MSARSRAAGDQLQGLLMHGDHLLEHIEERTARLNRVAAAAINILLGVCVGMLAAYAIHYRLPQVDFTIVGPLMGGAGGALARLLSKDFLSQKRQERLRLDKLEAAGRLQRASQIVDFVKSQGRLLPVDVKEGAWDEVNRLVSNQKGGGAKPGQALLGILPRPESKE
jgi:hypothetical protein